MTARYHYAVFIGRFQPFHIGHLFVFEAALQHAERLIVLVGSSGGARTLRNPFTFDERRDMVTASLPEDLRDRVILLPLQDFTYDDAAWVTSVTQLVTQHTAAHSTAHATERKPNIALVGHNKDETTYYLKLFPEWAYIEVGNLDGINATAVRRSYFTDGQATRFRSDILLDGTIAWLRDFGKTEAFITLSREYRAIARFKSEWSHTPYPVIFTTIDALVRYRDEVLLITRKHFPGKDLLALPGGFLDKDETLYDGCVRELIEETGLGVDKTTLKAALQCHEIFDNPQRSTRGRVITCCYYFDLSHLDKRPAAQAADDAKALEWYTIEALDRPLFFEDHYFIIQNLLKRQLQLCRFCP